MTQGLKIKSQRGDRTILEACWTLIAILVIYTTWSYRFGALYLIVVVIIGVVDIIAIEILNKKLKFFHGKIYNITHILIAAFVVSYPYWREDSETSYVKKHMTEWYKSVPGLQEPRSEFVVVEQTNFGWFSPQNRFIVYDTDGMNLLDKTKEIDIYSNDSQNLGLARVCIGRSYKIYQNFYRCTIR